MKIDLWKICLFFTLILLTAYNIYPSHIEMSMLFEKSHMYELALQEMNLSLSEKVDVSSLHQAAKLNEIVGNIDKTVEQYKRIISINPLNKDAHINLVRIYNWSRKTQKVLSEYERYLVQIENSESDEPEMIDYKKELCANLCNLYSYRGDWDKFLITTEKLLEVDAGNPKLYIDLIDIYLRKRDQERVLDLCRIAEKKFSKNIEIIEKIAWVTYLVADYDYAQVMQEKLTEMQDLNKDHWFNLVSIYSRQGKKRKIIDTYKLMMDKFPGDISVQRDLTELFLENKKYKQAVAICEDMHAQYPDNIPIMEKLAYAFEMNAQYKKSLELLKKLNDGKHDDLELSFRIIELQLKLKENDPAIKRISQMLIKYADNKIILHRLAQICEWNNLVAKSVEIYETLLIVDADNVETHQKLAELYQLLGKHEQAIAYLESLVSKYPKKDDLKKQLLSSYYVLNENDKIISLLESLVQSDPSDLVMKEDLADLYLSKNEFNKANELLKELAEKKPADSKILENLAWTSESVGDKKMAINCYEKLVQIDKNEKWISALAWLYVDNNDHKKVIGLLEKYRPDMALNRDLYMVMIDSLIAQKQYARATGISRKVLDGSLGAQKRLVLRKIADIMMAQQEFSDAKEILVGIYKENPQDSEVAKLLGDVFYFFKDYNQAITYYEDYLAENSKDYETRYSLALAYDQAGQKDKSKRIMRDVLKSIKVLPEDIAIRKMYAKIYGALNNYFMALKYYEKLLRHERNNIELFRDYIDFLSVSGKYSSLIRIVESSNNRFRSDHQIQRYLGYAYLAKEDYDNSLIIFNRLVSQFPEDADLMSDLAFIFQMQGRWDKSLKIYKDILRIKPVSWHRYAQIQSETNSLLKTYAPSLKTSYLLIDEIKKDTSVYSVQTQAYLRHNILVKAGFSRYFFRDNSIEGEKISEYVSETNIELEYFFNRNFSLNVGPFSISHGEENIYTFALGLNYNNFENLHVKFDVVWEDRLVDPRKSVFLGGRTNHIDLYLNWAVTDFFRIVAEGSHSEYRFADKVRDLGLSTRPGSRTQLVAGADLSLWFDPHIALTYRCSWTDSEVDSEYESLLAVESKVRAHQFGILYDHEISKKISLFGTAFVGNDDDRDMFLSRMALYGYEIGLRIEPIENFETGASYTFQYEKGLNSSVARSKYVNAYGMFHF